MNVQLSTLVGSSPIAKTAYQKRPTWSWPPPFCNHIRPAYSHDSCLLVSIIMFFNSFFIILDLLYQPMLLGQGGCCMSNFSFIILHCSVILLGKLVYPYSPLWAGFDFICTINTYISFNNLFYHPSCHSHSKSEECHSTTHSFLKGLSSLCFSILSSVVLHCSINSCFWEGVDIACQTFLLSSCIALSFHTTRKKLFYSYSLLWEGVVIIYISINKSDSIISSIILHVSSIPNFRRMPFDHSFLTKGLEFSVFLNTFFCYPSLLYHMLLGGGGCCMSNFSFIILQRESHSTVTHSFGRGLLLSK